MAKMKHIKTDVPTTGTRYLPIALDDVDLLQRKLVQLKSGLVQAHGEGLGAFRSLSPKMMDFYVWMLSDLVSECIEAAERIGEEPANA